jgi:hypothetical protein
MFSDFGLLPVPSYNRDKTKLEIFAGNNQIIEKIHEESSIPC